MALLVTCAVSLPGCGSGGPESPTVPTPVPSAPPAPTTTAVSVTFAGDSIFIGNTIQFDARETLSNGTTRVATAAAWGSDKLAVLTVSPTGLVTAVAAGEATVFVDSNNVRGALLVRVFPNFGGTWSGTEVATSCEDSGAFTGLCAAAEIVGDVIGHQSTFTQAAAVVNAVIDTGDGTTAVMTGTISIDGELSFPPTMILPADPELNAQLANWRVRADTPSRMTGTYDLVITVPGSSGSVRIGVRLQNVVKVSASAAASRTGAGALGETFRRRVWRQLQRS